jgi:hypothetical protein
MCTDSAHLFHFCNINSYFSKREQVKTCLSSPPGPSFLALCEIKIASDEKRSFKVPGYEAILKPHSSQSSGLLLYVKHSLPHAMLDELALTIGASMIVFMDVVLSTRLCVRVGVAYVHPDAAVSVQSINQLDIYNLAS